MYLRVFFVVLSVSLSSIFAFSAVVIFATKENYNVKAAVERQQQTLAQGRICLYDSALANTTTIYKLEIYRALRPDVLVLGSSRMMQVRPQFFSVPMVNAGGAGGNIAQSYHFLRAAFVDHRPKYILLGLDFWSFNDAFQAPDNMNVIPQDLAKPTSKLGNLLLPFKWIYDGDVQLSELHHYASNCHLGALAATKGNGFGPNGSYYYNSLIYGLKPNHSNGFEDTLDRIRDGRNRFQYGETVSLEHYRNFAQLVQLLRDSGVRFSIILPPVAKATHGAMKALGNKYGYVWELERKLSDNYGVVSFLDPGGVSGTDCEFVDGFHGGDVVYARIIAALASGDPTLNQFVDSQAIQRASNMLGRAYAGEYRFQESAEVDFLNLGCAKSVGLKE